MAASALYFSPFFFLRLVFALSPSCSRWSVVFRLCSSQSTLRLDRAKFSASGVTSGGPSTPLHITIVSLLPLPRAVGQRCHLPIALPARCN